MKIPSELTDIIEKMINDEVDRRIKDISVHILIDGELVDVDICNIDADEIYVEIHTPIYFSESSIGCVLAPVKESNNE